MLTGAVDTAETFRRMWAEAKFGLWGIVLLSSAVNLLLFAGPLYMLQVYDRVLASRSLETLTVLTIALALVLVVQAWFDALRSSLITRVGRVMDAHLAGPSLSALIRFGAAGLAQAKAHRPTNDLEQLRLFAAGNGPIVLADLPWMPLFVLACFLLHPLIGWLVLAGAGVLLTLGIIAERVARQTGAMEAERRGERLTLSEAARRNAETVTALGMERAILSRMGSLIETVNGNREQDINATLAATSRAVRLALQSGVLALGTWLVIDGQMLVGAMIVASILAGRALQPAEAAITHWAGFVAARQALARLQAAMSLVPKDRERLTLAKPSLGLEVDSAGIVAPNGRVVLDGVRFELAAGDVLGVIGKSGAGKTSLARVLCGIWPLARGRISLDGADLAQWDAAARGQFTGFLSQDVGLFEGTIAQNIARLSEAPAEAVVAAARAAGAHDLIVSLPNGYEHRLNDGATSLSAGQRQRVGLARALFGDPFLVVLDEPNANLDTAGEAALARALKILSHRKAVTIVMTHRQSVLAQCNKLLVLEDGRQVSFGTRDAVLAELKALQNAVVPLRRRKLETQP
jgi:PrtD family type I secretion system ABC transporter